MFTSSFFDVDQSDFLHFSATICCSVLHPTHGQQRGGIYPAQSRVVFQFVGANGNHGMALAARFTTVKMFMSAAWIVSLIDQKANQ